MSTTLQTDLLALEDIQARLGEQLKANQTQLQDLQAELQEQNVKLSQVQVHAQQVRSEISQWQTMDQRNATDVRIAQQDLTHAKGSSLEASRMERLTAADSARQKSQHELSILTTQLEKANQEADRITEQVQALTAKLNDLAATRDELVATQGRITHELVEAITGQGNEAVASVQSERERLREKAAQADTYYDQAVAQFGLKLAAIDERAALDFLANHIRIDENTPAVLAVKAQLVEATSARDTAQRQRAQSGDDILPTVQGYHQQVLDLSARIEMLRQQARERAARAFLAKLQQPVPVVPDDLAQAQALHAQAQVQPVVVEEAKPARDPVRERVTPQRGMRTFAALGAVAPPSPSLLNPKVRE